MYILFIYFKNIYILIILQAIYQLAIKSIFIIICLYRLNYPSLIILYLCLLRRVRVENILVV